MKSRRTHLLRALLIIVLSLADPALGKPALVVGSKNFAENRLLAEMFAQLIEAKTDLEVVRRLNLAGTQVCFDALRSGSIDLYPEYTGTGLVSLLGQEPEETPAATLNVVRREFLERWNLRWLAPLGFENAYEVTVPTALAARLKLSSISDLVQHAPELRAGFGFEFVSRKDGLPGLESRYGLQFKTVQPLQQALKYQAVATQEIDVLDAYTTDGRLLVHELQILDDDLGFFPSYQAAVLVRSAALDTYPEVGRALGLLDGTIDADMMRALNYRLQEGGESYAVVAGDALLSLRLIDDQRSLAETPVKPSLFRHFWAERATLLRRTAEHLQLSLIALFLGAAVAIPLGLFLLRAKRSAETLIRLLGVTQTIPSIALLAFMIPLLGVGFVPAIMALWIYSLFPMVRNTFTGVRDANPQVIEAATALGMTRSQILYQIRLPLAAPTIMAGVRTAGVITVGTATLAAFIGAGGLGEPIVTGLQLANSTLILSGAIPAAILALMFDFALGQIERALHPKGI
jgi:osmoprotectant transport system permease protein